MVDVAGKSESTRTAVAAGSIRMSPEAFALVEGNSGPKGDVLSTAELAATMGAKRTADLIPLCHPIGLDGVQVDATLDSDLPGVRVQAEVKAVGKTGVEMEALTAVAVGLLTVYDMVKAAGHGMEIGDIRLLHKTGGTRGDWHAANANPAT
ncbi:MAG: cyclic pyranopterin monophosphate synthase MoaC [Gemmatimonadota bacterium]|nr:MAG: cyclic pyranopterin monophosphate synthase MoaC [Gemmatimonadota bacterium]